MKKQNSLRTLLGLSQQDMAMLLNVTRGQYSMYECGHRNLPHHAAQLLSELLLHANAPQTVQKQSNAHDTERHHLEALLRENQYQQLLLEKKTKALEKKHNASLHAGRVVDFVKARNAQRKNNDRPLAVPARKASANDDYVKMGIDFEIKRELLVYEKKLLEQKIKDMARLRGDV
ncbi:helix-turn-helix domain-containing protein [Flavobacterium caeni]|uniref:Helix-turn-helix n=1 Tax=Flavobacterium caeni TaxID=490189 RepID=A0A1G5FD08_9FLAO|nr:helix-turn-helix domain-containing protein [Flavobacterium caeni]SCY37067.1 Helix-turn-helix [Flavobacterium caeni]